MTSLFRFVSDRRDYLLLAAMLASLHLAIWIDFGSLLSRALFLIHLGFFLLWQPLERTEERYSWYNSLLLILLSFLFVYFINWWLVFIWLVLILGIVGGRVVNSRAERFVYYIVMVFLFSEILLICLPMMFTIATLPKGISSLNYLLLLVPVLLPLFKPAKRSPVPVDIIYAITTSLLVSLIALGSLVIMYSAGTDYVTALIRILLAIGLFLLFISWLLSANIGLSGFSQIWTKSLLSIGTPFETWLDELSALKDLYDSAEEYLDVAIEKLLTLDWISGTYWNNQLKGKKSSHKISLDISNKPIEIYTHIRVGGAVLIHCKLLIRLIEYFYQAKLNEIELAKQAHLQAIFETGARITHDIKNLLQSMHSMVTILQADTDERDARSLLILKKQFPYFIQRLEQAVNKLQSPEQMIADEIYLRDWWNEFMNHYRSFDIQFKEDINSELRIPFDLFDSVTENLVENAINKRKLDPEIDITVTLQGKDQGISIEVEDSGQAIPGELADRLFQEPVKSDNGLGIGLLQAAKQAATLGYELKLEHNSDGKVCFRLEKSRSLNQGS